MPINWFAMMNLFEVTYPGWKTLLSVGFLLPDLFKNTTDLSGVPCLVAAR